MSEYNGLTGVELKALILKTVERVLDADTAFSGHVTFPRVSFKVVVELEAYPREAPKFGVVAEGSRMESGFRPEAGEGVLKVKLEGEGPRVGAAEKLEGEEAKHLEGHLVPTGPAADEVRAEEGMPIPHKRKVKNVGTVDSGATTTG